MPATRTQVIFTEEQRRQLDARARREGKTLAQVVREAVDAYVTHQQADVDTPRATGRAAREPEDRRARWCDRRRTGIAPPDASIAATVSYTGFA